MSDRFALRLTGLGKRYKVFDSRTENFLDALGLTKLTPWRTARHREFWALRGVDLELRRGQRVGVIGRNGAGKTTLLKLVIGGLLPTEGSIQVEGSVQALLDAGGGLHPEFTGVENIRAALTYQGLSASALKVAEHDIAEFTELGDFLSQPFKTYSLGMQARLAFAIATTVEPDILIVDEVLGAGDAYFFGKSIERMHDLVSGGATALIVSHALDQIARFCDEAVWLERGRVVERGPTTQVLKQYERFIRTLEDRRLQGKSRRMLSARDTSAAHDAYGDAITVRLTYDGQPQSSSDVSEITLLRNGEPEDRLRVGDAQDADASQSAFVQLAPEGWSAPHESGETLYRSLPAATEGSETAAGGCAFFSLWTIFPDAMYAIEVEYRAPAGGLHLEVLKHGDVVFATTYPPATEWTREQVPIAGTTLSGGARANASRVPGRLEGSPRDELSRWPGAGQLRIEGVSLSDGRGDERAVYGVGEPLNVRVRIRAEVSGAFTVFPAAIVFRTDGVLMTRHVGEGTILELGAGDQVDAHLELGSVGFGNGYYVLSVGLYRSIDLHDLEPSSFYDYIDRSYEFQVVGAPRLHNELVIRPSPWRLSVRPDNGGPSIDVPPLWTPDVALLLELGGRHGSDEGP